MSKDGTKAFYEEHADAYEESTKNLQKEHWINDFIELLPSHAQVLDLGCAYGRDSVVFVKNNFTVTGIDFSEAMITKARLNVPEATFIAEDIREMELKENSFDGIWASAVLLHISKQEAKEVLTKLHSSLKDNGLLFLGMYLGEGEGAIKDNRYEDADKYYAFYSEKELFVLLKDNGFSIVKSVARPKDTYERNDVIELIARKTNGSQL
jgi:SAM-dependent methyltransferase